MLPGITGEDDATLLAQGYLEQIHHIVEADRTGLIKNNHRAGAEPTTNAQVGMQLCQCVGFDAVFAERVRRRSRRRKNHGVETFAIQTAGEFLEQCAFAGTGEAAKAGDAIWAGEDVRQRLALIGAEMGRWFTLMHEWHDRSNSFVYRVNQP